jgi:hypothetical protein
MIGGCAWACWGITNVQRFVLHYYYFIENTTPTQPTL